jgi:hypothetical protein
MIKNEQELVKRIAELEVTLKETDELIQKGFEASVFMVEPIKTQFVDELILKKLELDEKKDELKWIKEFAGV